MKGIGILFWRGHYRVFKKVKTVLRGEAASVDKRKSLGI